MIGPPGLPARFRMSKSGRTLHVPEIPARDLMRLFADNAWLVLIPHGMNDSDKEYLFGRLMDPADPLDMVRLYRAATRVLGGCVGWDWHVGQRLAVKARAQWSSFDAWSVRQGFDPYACAAPRLFNAVFSWLGSQCVKDSDAAKLEAELFAPPSLPPSILEEAPLWSAAEEGSGFMSAFAAQNKSS
ncbi:hypothetical protein ACIBG8_54215 [Nonomuraea sp. NPDC050556]|uniref:hypothetical protein n=1 Tax=Nonomuraea sp. NPDC050556 TaxID=3364369 RepID=UPI0037A2E5A0